MISSHLYLIIFTSILLFEMINIYIIKKSKKSNFLLFMIYFLWLSRKLILISISILNISFICYLLNFYDMMNLHEFHEILIYYLNISYQKNILNFIWMTLLFLFSLSQKSISIIQKLLFNLYYQSLLYILSKFSSNYFIFNSEIKMIHYYQDLLIISLINNFSLIKSRNYFFKLISIFMNSFNILFIRK